MKIPSFTDCCYLLAYAIGIMFSFGFLTSENDDKFAIGVFMFGICVTAFYRVCYPYFDENQKKR